MMLLHTPDYHDWDRREWVGEGQEPAGEPLPVRSVERPRWTKWEWVGDNGNEPSPVWGRAPQEMPEGDTALSGMRHNPGMAHWGGTRGGGASTKP